MTVIGANNQLYKTQDIQSVNSSLKPDAVTNKPVENSAIIAPARAIISSPLVSASVSDTLLRLQETGSVFNEEDASLMNVRGVVDGDRERFSQIIKNAAETGGYDNPVEYIHSLSTADQDVLKRVHSLAERSGVTDTDEEGAINLLLPREDHVDINNDGLVKIGKATSFYFPPPNAPQSVKDAWDETTKDMTSSEKMMAQVPFLMMSISANIKVDENGTAVGIYQPDDPEYKNPFGTLETEWSAMLDDILKQSEAGDPSDPRYEERVKLLTKFIENLSAQNSGTA